MGRAGGGSVKGLGDAAAAAMVTFVVVFLALMALVVASV
jgi:hypothetical protein